MANLLSVVAIMHKSSPSAILKNSTCLLAVLLALLCSSCSSNNNQTNGSGGSPLTNADSGSIDPEYASAMAKQEGSEAEREVRCKKIRASNPYAFGTDGNTVYSIYNDSLIVTYLREGKCLTDKPELSPMYYMREGNTALPDDYVKIGVKYKDELGTYWYRIENGKIVRYQKWVTDVFNRSEIAEKVAS